MTANSNKSKQGNKAAHRVIAGVLCGASVLSLVLSLVMPPISQAIANDAQAAPTEKTVMGGGSSSESTDVDDTGGDAENQNSDEVEGGEADSSNGVEQGQSEDQPEGELQVEDGESSDDGAVMAAAEGGQSQTSANNIASVDDLNNLANVNGTASFMLMNDIETSASIKLEKSGSNITLDLNGHKIKHKSSNQPLFNITGGATLTVKDSQQVAATEAATTQTNKYGNLASMEYNAQIPTSLTYYVTESTVSGTGTTETLKAYKADIKGAIVACDGSSDLKLINLYNNNGKGGTFKLESGVITQQQGSSVGSLVYAQDGSTVAMGGGYICGAFGSGAGGGIEVRNNSNLSISGGVIAGNSAPSGGGVFAGGSSVVTVTNGIISGNSTLDKYNGFGGGIMAEGGSITVSGGFITNNKYSKYCGNNGWGCHGGAGLAANNGAHVTISGGQITGNYSEEAGGGVYVTNQDQSGMAWLNITGGNIASNVSYRSEGAGIRVGQMVEAMINGSSKDSPVYITNNHCMSRFDWGGGGVFVQGCSETASNAGRLFVYNSYISSNTAGGYGGGVAVCPTGKTLLTNNDGTAIFGNKSAGDEQNYEGYEDGNDGTPHLSGGGHGKNQDIKAYNSEKFRDNGHADFFLAAEGHTAPIAAVTGKMLGGGDAQYSGSKELTEAITIPANGGVQVFNSIGLSSRVKAGDPAANYAQNEATTFITGNYSWNHGGGIMSNGNLYLGTPADTYVYPSLKLKATKQLVDSSSKDKLPLSEGQFSFTVYRKDSTTATKPSWNQGKFNDGGCTKVATVSNNEDGAIAFNLGEQYAAGGEDNRVVYYLVEDGGSVSDVKCDQAVYEIDVTTEDTVTPLIDGFKIHSCAIQSVKVTKHASDGTSSEVESTYSNGECEITTNGASTFTNVFTKYDSKGSWTPKATKVVEGGEMKEFTLEFANNEKFDNAKTVNTTAGGNNPQTLGFGEINYTLDDLTKGEDVTGRGASGTFTYYVREQKPTTPFTNYKYDQSVYKITVNAADQSDKKTIKCDVTYTKIVDAKGGEIAEKDQKPLKYGEDTNAGQSLPTFTNTYSTTLPLSGMSGVTLTYLAGAAVLCAAAAWMHIRRKANAKGGERRE